MEEKIIKIILGLRNIRGYGNKKIISFLSLKEKLLEIHESLYKNSSEYVIGFKNADSIIKLCKKEQIKIITYLDKEYLDKLKKINSPPAIIFAKGKLDILSEKTITVVGSRNSSQKTKQWIHDEIKNNLPKDYVVVSGGAKGVDIQAHISALESGKKTVCVLGSGINNIYPEENKEIIKKIMNEGLVLSEQLPLAKVNKYSLLERNRITSGLGDKILIISTSIKGGTISQFNTARKQKKQIFCADPFLGLEPSEGIKELTKKFDVPKITNIKEALNQKIKQNPQTTLQ